MKVFFNGRREPYRAWRPDDCGPRELLGGMIFATVLVIGSLGYEIVMSPWPLRVTLKHIAAAPNCAAARRVGLAPARIGEPGYYSRHDADHDGIACEPWSRR
jgi:hypothetical protein